MTTPDIGTSRPPCTCPTTGRVHELNEQVDDLADSVRALDARLDALSDGLSERINDVATDVARAMDGTTRVGYRVHAMHEFAPGPAKPCPAAQCDLPSGHGGMHHNDREDADWSDCVECDKAWTGTPYGDGYLAGWDTAIARAKDALVEAEQTTAARIVGGLR